MKDLIVRLILALAILLGGCIDEKDETDNGAVLGVSKASPGCGNDAFSIPDGPITIEVDGKERTYLLILPDDSLNHWSSSLCL